MIHRLHSDEACQHGVDMTKAPLTMLTKTSLGQLFAWMLAIMVLITMSQHYISSDPKPPHIVLVLADDLGWSDVGWHNPNIITPNLDALARNGVILNSSYVFPRCTPSRASLMTGYYSHRIGLQYGVINLGERSLPLHFDLLPEKLKEAGYSTHIVGKWHLGLCSLQHTPVHRGFDSFFGYYSGSLGYFGHLNRGFYDLNHNNAMWEDLNKTYSTHLFRDRAKELIRNHDPSRPLFLYLPFQSVHSPLEVPRKYRNMYPKLKDDRGTYCGMVTAMDEAVGDIVSELDSNGFMDNLLFLFMSDNGGRPSVGGYNWPLRGAKNTLWEGGTRSAGFLYSKTLLRKKGIVSNILINIADWFPTLLELAGVNSMPSDLDGVSQWGALNSGQDAAPARTENVYSIETRAAIRVGSYKLLKGNPGCAQQTSGEKCLRGSKEENGWVAPEDVSGKTKPVEFVEKDYLLFNLDNDPLEEHDLSEKLPDVVDRLKKKLEYHVTRSVPHVKPTYITSRFSSYMGKNKVIVPGWCD